MVEVEYTDITKYYVLANPQLLDADLNAKTHAFLSVPHNIDHEKLYFDEHLRQFCNTGLLICTESAISYPEIEFSYKGSKKLKVIELDDQEHAAILLTMKCINSFTPIFMELREYKMKNGTIILPDISEEDYKIIQSKNYPLTAKSFIQIPICRIIAIKDGNVEYVSMDDLAILSIINTLAKKSSQRLISLNEMVNACNNRKTGTSSISTGQALLDKLYYWHDTEFYVEIVSNNETQLFLKGHPINVYEQHGADLFVRPENGVDEIIRIEEYAAGKSIINGNVAKRAFRIIHSGLFDAIDRLQEMGASVECINIQYPLLGRKSGHATERNKRCELFLAKEITIATREKKKQSSFRFEDVYTWAGAETSKAQYDVRDKVKTQLEYIKCDLKMIKDYKFTEFDDSTTWASGKTPDGCIITY